MKEFPEEELHDILMKIKKLKRQMFEAKKEKIKLEKVYEIKYAFNDWKKKEGKYFLVKGKKNELFYCYVIEVNDKEKKYEFIDLDGGYYATETITNPKEDCGYESWTEVSQKEYEEEKADKSFAE